MNYKLENFFSEDLPAASSEYKGFPEYNFVGGHNSEKNIPVKELVISAEKVILKEGKNLALYGHNSGPQGNLALREFLVSYLRDYTGINVKTNNILLTSGSLQALDLVNKLLLKKGDTVLVEEATYGGAISRLENLNVNHVGIKLDNLGICPDHLIETLEILISKNIYPKFLYTIPTVQNPTATVMPEERRKKIIEIAEKYNFLIFEDDCYADLTWNRERPKSIYSFCNDERIIYCGSFSKSIAPALRVGYIIASWKVISKILAFKNDGGSGAIEQMILADFCKKNYKKHVDELVIELERKCELMMQCLEIEFGSTAEFTKPKGGIFIWITFPDVINTDHLFKVASEKGIALNPGSEWVSKSENGMNKIRLCFANPTDKVIRDGVRNLAQICFNEFGIPSTRANIKR
ncbi:MAG: 2-aminoadipate transaminase [Alphaproteobacteria bacterium MarineAlpha9_Bin3]|nr:MAG: 2-aminoadipate transaminase [Alphaproteobacteria bacterium MarineAlpha9_Bin3]|tara:strand:- start:12992 stop:14212 length:1221 start_codon:yes stop_codon:yes gene_type:complete